MAKKIQLFPDEKIVGIFRGFGQGGMEFRADLVLPYQNKFQNIPMHGQFLLVQLGTPDEAVLGRITSFSSEGKLSDSAGEEFNIRAVRENREIPEDLREQYLKYRVNIRVLGVLRRKNTNIVFVASHRRLPHVGSPVAFPSNDVLREIVGHDIDETPIGHLAFGEYIYAPATNNFKAEEWMQLMEPEILAKFPLGSLVSRRSFVFARAGFGKSNLNKLLFSKLYKTTPHIKKRDDREVPVGTIIFDPDGEYFWPDDRGRPGLCDVPEISENLVVFTRRCHSSKFYQSFVAGGVLPDIRRLPPNDVISIALAPERQNHQNVRKLRGLSEEKWKELVNLIDDHGNSTPISDVCEILELDKNRQEAEALAARSNMTLIVRMLHDKSSLLMDMLIRSLSEGKLCVIDFSQMRSGQSLILSGLILRRIFDYNQEKFISAEQKTIPTIAVVEEAQSVLNDKALAAEPYITWVKEGRKYDLGALLITQQPGSIPVEILSQGDNWFIFHLLSSEDLTSLKRANSHFSDDLLSSLLNEPIPGHGVFWSSVEGKPYPISIRALSFEDTYPVLDSKSNKPEAETYAQALIKAITEDFQLGPVKPPQVKKSPEQVESDEEQEPLDIMAQVEDRMIHTLENDGQLMNRIRSKRGVAWGTVKAFFLEHLPISLDDRDKFAYHLVSKAMNKIFGQQDEKWESYKTPSVTDPSKMTTYIRERA